MAQPMQRGTATNPTSRLVLLLALVVVVVVAAAVAVLVIKARGGSTLNLTGNWTAQDGPITVYLTLAGTNQHLTGTLTTKNAPLPIKGTVTAQVTGDIAHVQVHALGQVQTATCKVSSTKMVCTGSGHNTILTLTFTRP